MPRAPEQPAEPCRDPREARARARPPMSLSTQSSTRRSSAARTEPEPRCRGRSAGVAMPGCCVGAVPTKMGGWRGMRRATHTRPRRLRRRGRPRNASITDALDDGTPLPTMSAAMASKQSSSAGPTGSASGPERTPPIYRPEEAPPRFLTLRFGISTPSLGLATRRNGSLPSHPCEALPECVGRARRRSSTLISGASRLCEHQPEADRPQKRTTTHLGSAKTAPVSKDSTRSKQSCENADRSNT